GNPASVAIRPRLDLGQSFAAPPVSTGDDQKEATMSLTRTVLRLARNPGYPQGDDSQGYVITAPLDSQGHLAVEEWRRQKSACTVVRFKPGEEHDADGWLSHRGDAW